MNRFKKYVSAVFITTLIFVRVFSVVSVYGQELPVVPTMPSNNQSLPPPPPQPDSLSFVPTVPPPPDTSQTLPTVPAPPTNPPPSTSVPTVPPLPTSAGESALPTSSSTNTTTIGATNPTGTSGDGDPTQNSTYGADTSGDSGQGGTNSSTGSNSGYTGGNGTSNGEVNDPANIGTGAGSTNSAYELLDHNLAVMNQNLAEMQNKINQLSSSGFNYANLNTLSGQVFTGDTQVKLNLLNKLNSNMTGTGAFSTFNIYDNYLGDIVFNFPSSNLADGFSTASGTVSKNAVTGPNSTNIAAADSKFTVKEENGNDATINNDIDLAAITGGNTASFNTGNGSITTGNASAVANIVNLANTNLNVAEWLFGIVNIFGTLTGNIILPDGSSVNLGSSFSSVLSANQDTGAFSNNTANYTSNETTTFTNNNNADVVTAVNTSANTGNNSASINTGGGSVTTGNTDVSVSNSTIANENINQEDDTVWLVIVNEAGKWVGHIVGSLYGATSASNALPVSQTTSGAGSETFTTTNSGTGAFSDNVATQNSTSNTEVTNNNTAKIVNNVNVTADSGNNDSSYNTGAGEITTGNASVGLNLLNIANTNVVAKKFAVILVNILGSWLGDVVTPDSQLVEQPADSALSTNGTENSTGFGGVSGPVLPTLPILPTLPPVFTSTSDNFDTATEPNQTTTYTYSDTEQTQGDQNGATTYYYYNYPDEYTQAVNTVNTQKQQVSIIRRTYRQGVPQKQQIQLQVKAVSRGLFLSPAFAKATQTSSIAGILLGGASIRVTNSWLWIVPVALFLFFVRRRKKYDFAKYLDSLLEILL